VHPDSNAWIDEIKRVDLARVAGALGMKRGAGRSFTLTPCPACKAEVQSRTRNDRRGPVVLVHGGRGWCCVKCSAKGSAADLIAYALTGERLDGSSMAKVRGEAARHGLCTGSAADEEAERQTRATIRWRTVQADARRPVTDEQIQSVGELWRLCVPVSDDPEAVAYLTRRALPVAAIEDRDLARVIPPNARLPRWARVGSRSWVDLGNRLVLPLFGPDGRLVSVRARYVREAPPVLGKSLAPGGLVSGGTVLADPLARLVLASGAAPGWWPVDEPLRIIVGEGEPDFLTWATRSTDGDATAPAVISIPGSGSWTAEVAARIPSRATVLVQTHDDDAGEKYAQAVARSLSLRCRVLVRRREVAHGR
jgi:hypothetical protein